MNILRDFCCRSVGMFLLDFKWGGAGLIGRMMQIAYGGGLFKKT